MIKKRSLLALAGAVLMIGTMVPITLSQGLDAGLDDITSPESVLWELRAHDGPEEIVTVYPGTGADLVLESGSASFNAGCDYYFAEYTIDGSAISFAQPEFRTNRQCTPEANDLEEAYLASLEKVASWQPYYGALQLLAEDGEVMLEFSEGTVEISQRQLDAILSQLAELELRIEALETPPSTDTPSVAATPPKAPAAKGKVQRRFTIDGADPDRGLVKWKDRADDEDGYRLYARRIYCGLKPDADPNELLDYEDFTEKRSGFVRVGKVGADTTQFRPVHRTIEGKLPPVPRPLYGTGAAYDLYVAAFSEVGESKRVPIASYTTTPEWFCP